MTSLVGGLLNVLADLSRVVADTMHGRRGEPEWSVEPIAPEDLGKGRDAVELVYHEGDRQLWPYGTRGTHGTPGRVAVPSREAWSGAVQPWAHERRAQLRDRIASDARVRGRFELVEARP